MNNLTKKVVLRVGKYLLANIVSFSVMKIFNSMYAAYFAKLFESYRKCAPKSDFLLNA